MSLGTTPSCFVTGRENFPTFFAIAGRKNDTNNRLEIVIIVRLGCGGISRERVV
jgi:hypothetical protein